MTDIERLPNKVEALERDIERLTNRAEALERNVRALKRPVRKLRLAMSWVLLPAIVLGVWKAAAEYDWSGWLSAVVTYGVLFVCLGAVGVVVTYGVLFVWLLKEPGKDW